jgi:uncharacterized YccA/Bax inhibitor family protein
MASSNPAFSNSPAFSDRKKVAGAFPIAAPPASADMSAQQLTELYSQPSATPLQTDRMTYEDTMVKIIVSFGVLILGAVVGWFVPVLFVPAALIGFVLALVNIFKKKPSAPLVLAYAAVEGIFVGGITNYFEGMWPGIAIQAVIGTAAVIGVTFALFASGKVRASARATKVFLIAMVGYGVFSLINFALILTGVNKDAFGLQSAEVRIPFIGISLPLGVIIGVLVVVMAAYSLVLDFDSIKTGVTRGAPRAYAWTAAFGLLVTVVWLYLEILRILALLRR